jgi:hypothetical protein
MKIPKTAEEIANEIVVSSDKSREVGDLRIRQLIQILRKVDSELIVEGIIRVFENRSRSETLYKDQEFAGKVLESINPKTYKQLEEVLPRVLLNWDKSVEQLPFWLKENYGIETLKESFAILELTLKENEQLKTMKWWLQLNETSA